MWLLELLNIFYCPNITKSAPILIQLTREIIMRVFRLQNHKVSINLYIDFFKIIIIIVINTIRYIDKSCSLSWYKFKGVHQKLLTKNWQLLMYVVRNYSI